MGRAYSDDLRKKLLDAHTAGKGTLKELAERFGVSVAWAWKVSAARRQSGSTARTPQRRAPSQVDVGLLCRLVRAQPDIVLRELSEAMAQAGHPASPSHLWRMLRKAGLRLKKSRSTPSSATPKRIVAGAKSSSKSSGRRRPKI